MHSETTPPWWQTAVIYQIYPRSWADANADGIGDFMGMTSRLDHLVDVLPVDAVWVSPFYPSPQADFGYDVSDYCDVDPMFGDLEAFKEFLAACHQRGLKVIIDWVPNHTSQMHPWFVESRESTDGGKRDWYVWRDPKPDGTPPNNWLSIFGGPAWTLDEATGQYYLHSFLADQPDLNWRNEDVVQAMLGTLRFWLELGVDGFRIDVAHRCLKDPQLRDNPPASRPAEEFYKPNAEYLAFDHLYDGAHSDIHLLFRRIRATIDEYEDIAPRFLVGEIHEYDWKVWAGYYGWSGDELHMPFNFALLPAGLDPLRIRRAVEGLEAALPSGAWPNWVYGNHDESRIASRLGWDESRAAAVLLLTLRGTPTLYYGDELGMLQAEIAPEDQQDPWGRKMPGFGRDGCRTPMQWDGSTQAGFTTGTPWLAPLEQERLSVTAQLGDPAGHLELYRRLLAVRRRHQSLQVGDIEFLSGWERPNPLMYRRSGGPGSEVVVALNLSAAPANLVLAGMTGWPMVAGTDPARWDLPFPGILRLAPWEGVILAGPN